MKATIQTEPEMKMIGDPVLLFSEIYLDGSVADQRCYDISSDGTRFLMIEPLADQPPLVTELKVIVNWFEELRTKIPTGDDQTP